jgi:hypothetical protein
VLPRCGLAPAPAAANAAICGGHDRCTAVARNANHGGFTMFRKTIATVLSSVLISSTMLGACASKQEHEPVDVGATAVALDLSQFDPSVDCYRPAEDVFTELGLVSQLEAAGTQEELDAVLSQVAGICDGVPDDWNTSTDPGTGSGSDYTVSDGGDTGGTGSGSDTGGMQTDPSTSDTTTVSAGAGSGDYTPTGRMATTTPTSAPVVGAVAMNDDVMKTVFKCILGILGADIALDVYQSIIVPWKYGLRGAALLRDAKDILWNRLKRKGFKYTLKALGGLGAAIGCFVDIIGAVARTGVGACPHLPDGLATAHVELDGARMFLAAPATCAVGS